MNIVNAAAAVEKTILIVDDEASVLSALQRTLRREGFRIITACAADEALRILAGDGPRPQVVVSDFRMPQIDGLSFLREVRQRWPRVQRILLTGYADLAALERAVNETEIFRYLSKPWDDSVLITTIRSALEEYDVRSENERLLLLTQEQNQRLADLNRVLEARVLERTRQLELAKRDWEVTFDSIADPVVIVDREYLVRRSNRSFATYSGVDVRGVPGRSCHQTLFGETAPCKGCPLPHVLETRQAATGEVADRERDRLLQVLAYPIASGDGELQHVVCQYRDVTEEKEMQQRLLQAEKLSGIGLLAGGVAHEINNPLAGILAFTQLLMREIPREDERRSFLDEIEQSALRCKRIVESLLKFSRRTPGSERSPVVLNDVLGSTLFLVEHQYQLRNVEIVRELEPALWPVKANANQLSQVTLNLLTNAYAAMAKGGRIVVRTWNDTEKAQVHLSVKDSGQGIPRKNLQKIFEPFFTTKGDGTGLGLTVTFDIVQSHGGSIAVTSEEGQGAEFLVSLPAMGGRSSEAA